MKVFIKSAESAEGKKSFVRTKSIKIVNDKKIPFDANYFENKKAEDLQGKVFEANIVAQEGFPDKLKDLVHLPDEDIENFYEKTSLHRDNTIEWMKKKISEGDETLKNIVFSLLFDNEQFLKRFKTWPASIGHHHDFDGGLLEHTYFMAKYAELALETDEAYSGANSSVVMAAIMLHDFGKIIEYNWTIPGPATPSERGSLLGHISLGDELIVRACSKLGIMSTQSPVLQLRHCILSHHGKKKWGSPVTPSIIEAVLIHQIDMIQSRGEGAKKIINSLELGQEKYSNTFNGRLRKWE